MKITPKLHNWNYH